MTFRKSFKRQSICFVMATKDILTKEVTNAAKEVYKILGAGYEESIYEEAMGVEFRKRNIEYEVERNTEVFYKGERVGMHRLDFILEHKLVVELKATTRFWPSHTAQVASYLKTLGVKKGMLVNFPYPEKTVPEIKVVEV